MAMVRGLEGVMGMPTVNDLAVDPWNARELYRNTRPLPLPHDYKVRALRSTVLIDSGDRQTDLPN